MSVYYLVAEMMHKGQPTGEVIHRIITSAEFGEWYADSPVLYVRTMQRLGKLIQF